MNQVALIGRLTKDPELRKFAGGAVQAGFVLAVEKKFKDKEADFVLCSIWGKQAQSTVEYCGKGSLISVCGRLQSRSYMKGDARVFVTEVLCDELKFLQLKPPAKSEEQHAEEMLSAKFDRETGAASGNPDPAAPASGQPRAREEGSSSVGHDSAPPGTQAPHDRHDTDSAAQDTRPVHNGHVQGHEPPAAHAFVHGPAAAAVSPGRIARGTGELPDGLALPAEESPDLPVRH
ncbi:single-stranded DNA-binding protein [Bhargavaea ullalensis]|uniref:Single-stranded DNA-binding protein n=1 Tax=Bhargavaea ullalensis TaxID=1265685 RepID=A0ABV2GBJ2_9BACL